MQEEGFFLNLNLALK